MTGKGRGVAPFPNILRDTHSLGLTDWIVCDLVGTEGRCKGFK